MFGTEYAHEKEAPYKNAISNTELIKGCKPFKGQPFFLFIFTHLKLSATLTELIIHLDSIDPIDLLGINNSRLQILKNAFPA
jgi:hypothetical protein